MEIKLLVLDMAGTTIDEDNVVYKTLAAAINHHGYNVSLQEVLRLGAGMEKSKAIRTILENAGGDTEDTDAIYEKFAAELSTAYEMLDVKPIKGVEAFLRECRAKGKKVVLNTGYNKKVATQLLEKLGWKAGDQYDGLITADDVKESRPSPEMVVLAMKNYCITDAKQVMKAGDSAIDIEEGKNAGCGLTVGVLSGAQDREQLEAAKPDYIYDYLPEAAAVIF